MCRYINALAAESYVRANSAFIKIAGLPTAAYMELLCSILTAVDKKKRYDPTSGFWKIDRGYIEDRCGISPSDQRGCDEILAKLGIVESDPDNPNRIRVDSSKYYSLIIQAEIPDVEISSAQKKTKSEKTQAKKAALIDLYSSLFGYSDEKSNAAVKDLVEAYYSKGYVKKAQWIPVASRFSALAKDPDAVEELASAVLASNYQSIPNAIDAFVKSHVAGSRIGIAQKTRDGVSDLSF